MTREELIELRYLLMKWEPDSDCRTHQTTIENEIINIETRIKTKEAQ